MARLLDRRTERISGGIGGGGGIPKDGLALIHVLTKVEADVAQSDLLIAGDAATVGGSSELLDNLELDGALCQVVITVDGDADN